MENKKAGIRNTGDKRGGIPRSLRRECLEKKIRTGKSFLQSFELGTGFLRP
jgi:hypothetical protein